MIEFVEKRFEYFGLVVYFVINFRIYLNRGSTGILVTFRFTGIVLLGF